MSETGGLSPPEKAQAGLGAFKELANVNRDREALSISRRVLVPRWTGGRARPGRGSDTGCSEVAQQRTTGLRTPSAGGYGCTFIFKPGFSLVEIPQFLDQ